MFGLMGQDGADSRGLFMYVSALKHITDDNNPRSDFKTSSPAGSYIVLAEI